VVGDAVQDHRADPSRVPLGVLRAEQRAVRAAAEGQGPLAQGGPDRLQVVYAAQRVHVVEERAGTLPAVRAQPAVVRHPGVDVGLAGEHRRRLLRQQVGRAAHRVAAADPAGVVADDVEPAVEARDEPAPVQHPVDAGIARPARHVHQRADPLGRLGGGQAHQREVDPRAARVGPVHRH
jgi:hypothetical protein